MHCFEGAWFEIVKLVHGFGLKGLKVCLPLAEHKIPQSNVVVHDENVDAVEYKQTERLESGHFAVVNALRKE